MNHYFKKLFKFQSRNKCVELHLLVDYEHYLICVTAIGLARNAINTKQLYFHEFHDTVDFPAFKEVIIHSWDGKYFL